MFIEKTKTEVITIDNEIKVVGLCLEKYGHPKNAGKIPEMWTFFDNNYRKKMRNVKDSDIGYWFWFNKPNDDHDYLVGNAVTSFNDVDDELTAFAIPAGRYIKDSFNAEDFGKLVDEVLQERKGIVKQWAEENNMKIIYMPPFVVTAIEVYPKKRIRI